MESLWHLPPPHAVGAVRMDRFSPYYNEAAAFGLVNVRPMEMYRLLYPLDERLRNLAYFFTYEREDGDRSRARARRHPARVERWRRAAGCRLTASRGSSGDLIVTDTRPEARHPRVALPGVQGEVYATCDQRHHRQGILRAMASRYQVDDAFEQWLDAFLAQMVEWKLMARDGDEYLSLAILEESVASAGQDTAA